MLAKGRHATRPSTGTRDSRAADPAGKAAGSAAKAPEPAAEPVLARSAPHPLVRVFLWTTAVVSLAIIGCLIYGLVQLDHDLADPGDGLSGWQCAATSGPCEDDS